MGTAGREGSVPAGRRDGGRSGLMGSPRDPRPQGPSGAAAGAHAALKPRGWGNSGLCFHFGFRNSDVSLINVFLPPIF